MSKKFYDIKNLVNETDVDDTYVVVEQFKDIDYSLIYRKSSYQPWVAAWCYRDDAKSWGQGHYFEVIDDALEYIKSVRRERRLRG